MQNRLFLGFARWAIGLALASLLLWVGCGPSPSQRENLQSIMENRSLSEEEKLTRLALAIFDLVNVEIIQTQSDGHAVSLAVRANNDSVIRQVMEGKPQEQLSQALKEFHFKLLNPQIAEYLRRAKDMRLQRLTVSLQPVQAGGAQRATLGDELYRLVLERDRFEKFLQVANLRAQEALPQAEKIWRVEVDQFK